jgi:hypothetical protein
LAINTLEELKQAALQVATDLEAAGEAQAAERVKATAGTDSAPLAAYLEQLIDALEGARRAWLKKGVGAKAFAVHKVASAASKLLQGPA